LKTNGKASAPAKMAAWNSKPHRTPTKKEFKTTPHTYEKPGKYKVMVKVVDIMGVDTSQVVEVNIKN
jgi:hypothetical protein